MDQSRRGPSASRDEIGLAAVLIQLERPVFHEIPPLDRCLAVSPRRLTQYPALPFDRCSPDASGPRRDRLHLSAAL